MTHLHFLSYAFVPLSVAMFPHLFQHWMTARSAKAFRLTVMLHPVFIMIVWAPCIMLGVWASAAVFTTACTTGMLLTCWARAWPEPPTLSNMAAAITDALPVLKNFFNTYSNYGGRPSIDRVT
jgi:hypothetical protein